jgi:hypothetical protein
MQKMTPRINSLADVLKESEMSVIWDKKILDPYLRQNKNEDVEKIVKKFDLQQPKSFLYLDDGMWLNKSEVTALLRNGKTVLLTGQTLLDRQVDETLLQGCQLHMIQDSIVSFKLGFIFNDNLDDLLTVFNKNLAEMDATGNLKKLEKKLFGYIWNRNCGDTTLGHDEGISSSAFHGICLLTISGMIFAFLLKLAGKLKSYMSSKVR